MDLEKVKDSWHLLLNDHQREFVEAMIVTQKASAAAAMVDISASTASKWLAAPKIQVAIKFRQRQLREDVAIQPSEVITDLRLLRDMALGRIPVPETKWVDGEPKTRYVTQYNAAAAHKAVESLGRVAGMFVDVKEIKIPATDNQLKKRLEELLGTSIEGDFTEVPADTQEEEIPTTTPIDSVSNKDINNAFEEIVDLSLNETLCAAYEAEFGSGDEP